MNSRLKVLLPWALISLWLLVYLLKPFVVGRGQSEVSNRTSPDGKHTVVEFKSYDDGAGHAPYGTSLSLSQKQTISGPENGDVFFAGYCQQPLSYAWRGNSTITVSCRATDKPALLTHAVLVRGIRVEVQLE